MPEARDYAVRRAGGEATAEIAGGFWIRRGPSPISVTGPRRRRGCAPSGTDNKENNPQGVGSSRCRQLRGRQRRSPLPEWYPRTPLRDITIIVNALERQRSRRAAAAARQREQDSLPSPQTGLPESPVEQELGVYEDTPNPAPPSELSDSFSNTPVAISSSLSPIEGPLQSSSSSSSITPAELPLQTISIATSPAPCDLKAISSCLSPTEHPLPTPSSSSPSSLTPTELPLQTVSIATRPALCDLKAIEAEKKLQSSIDKIESALMQNPKWTQKVPIRKTTRTLMSMR